MSRSTDEREELKLQARICRKNSAKWLGKYSPDGNLERIWSRSQPVHGSGLKGAREIEEGDRHKEWGHLHSLLKQDQTQRFALRQKRHHISTKDRLPQIVPKTQGPLKPQDFHFQRGSNIHLLLLSLGYQLKTLTHWSISLEQRCYRRSKSPHIWPPRERAESE